MTAEEIAKDIYIHHFDDDINYPEVLKAITAGVQKGLYFGFKNANEWHDLLKDPNDLPKDEKDMLMSEQLILFTKMKGTDNLSISLGQYNFSTKEFSYQHIVGLTEVIAWKEIVLPELKESK